MILWDGNVLTGDEEGLGHRQGVTKARWLPRGMEGTDMALHGLLGWFARDGGQHRVGEGVHVECWRFRVGT